MNVYYRGPRKENRLAKTYDDSVVGSYQSRAGKEGTVIGVVIKVKEIELWRGTAQYRDTYLVVEWEDGKRSTVLSSKVKKINSWSKKKIAGYKKQETHKYQIHKALRGIRRDYQLGRITIEQETEQYNAIALLLPKYQEAIK